MNTEQYYFNSKEAAAFCGYSGGEPGKLPHTIYRATKRYRETGGREGLRYSKIGHKTIRIARPDLIAWMDAQSPVLEECPSA